MKGSAVVKPLLLLQDIDAKIFKVRQKIAQLPIYVKQFQDKVDTLQAEVDKYKKILMENKLLSRQKETDLKVIEDKINQINVRFYQVKKNEEYQLLIKELEENKLKKEKLEEEIILLYEKIDGLEKEQISKNKDLQDATKALLEAKKFAEAELAKFKKEEEFLLKQRQQVISNIPQENLDSYQRVLNVKEDGLALARVKQVLTKPSQTYLCIMCNSRFQLNLQAQEPIFCPNCESIALTQVVDEEEPTKQLEGQTYICTLCNYEITSQDFVLLLINRELVFCKNCGRILFYISV